MSVDAAPVVAPSAPRRLEYRPALDGLRGVAVAGVVAFHLGHLRGGFLGVDLFFTLSGYLITRLLLVEHASTGRVALGAFWSRRAWRLLPALYLLLGALAVYAAAFARPDELDGIRGPGIASLLFVANWWFIGSGDGYWDIFAAPSPLEHVWSLAIEQQFYLVWPLLVAPLLGASRRVGRLLAVTIGLIAASTLLLGVLAGGDVSRAYFGSFARSGSILVGAALAIVVHRGDRWLVDFTRSRMAPWVGVLAVGLLGWSWVTIDGGLDIGWYRGGFLLHALAVAVIIALLVYRPDGPASRALSLGPLRGLGIVSYGFYLWHWPVIVILDEDRTGMSGATLLIVRLSIAMAATLGSYFLLERPARQVFAKRVSALVVFPIAAVLITLALIASTVPPPVEPVIGAAPPPRTAVDAAEETGPESVSSSGAEPEPETAGASDFEPESGSTGASEPTPIAEAPTVVAPDSVADTTARSSLLRTIPTSVPALRVPTVDDPLRVLIVGDSYLYDAEPGIVAATTATGVVAPAPEARFGFALTGGWEDQWEETLSTLVETHRPELVIAMWARFDTTWLETGDADEYARRLDQAVGVLTGDGAIVAFVGLAPSRAVGVNRAAVDRGINDLFSALPERHPGRVVYVDPDPIVAPDGTLDRWLETPEGTLLVRKVDVSHYCGDGSARFGLAVGELLQEMADVTPAEPAEWWAGEWRVDQRYDEPAGACA